MSEIIEMPMSQFNRIQDSILEAVALIGVRRGTITIIPDEPETRNFKNYLPFLPSITMTSLLKEMEQTATSTQSTTSAQEEITLPKEGIP